LFAALALLAGSGLFLDALPPDAYDIYWLLYLLVGSLIVWRFGPIATLMLALRQPLLSAVLGAALVSALWSPDPWLTVRWAVALIGTSLIGLFIGRRFTHHELLELLARALLAIMLISVAVALVAPGYGLEPFDRGYLPLALKGAARHRNALGAQATLMVTFTGAMLLTGALSWLRGLVFGGVATLVLILAQSVTSMACAASTLVLLTAFWGAKRLRLPVMAVAATLLAFTMILGVAFVVDPGRIAEALGRDPNFTERDIIWADAWHLIQASPLLGHGSGAVWGQFEATRFTQLETLSWASHAHNGYLQLATEVGVPVTVLAVAYLLGTVRRALVSFATRPSALALFALAATAMSVMMNATETWLIVPYEMLWTVFVALATALASRRPGPDPTAIPAIEARATQ
jgi:exopolysaccharide production protein ExoQ